MKTGIAAILVCAFLMLAATPAFSHDYDRNDSDYWLRIAAYVVYPVGYALEWGVTRPIHWVVSRPGLNHVFGHQSCPDDKYWQLEESCIKEHSATEEPGLYEVTPVSDADAVAAAPAAEAPAPLPAVDEAKKESPVEKAVAKEGCPDCLECPKK